MKTAKIFNLLLLSGLTACSPGAQFATGLSENQGQSDLDAGKYHRALVELSNAATADPQDGNLHLQLGRAFLAVGDGVGADAEFGKAGANGVPAPSMHHLRAKAFLLQGNTKRALEEANLAPTKFRPEALIVQGWSSALDGDTPISAGKFSTAMASYPDNAMVLANNARFELSRGNLDSAKRSASRALSVAPQDIDALTASGEVDRANRHFSEAISHYDKALQIDDLNVSALLGKAATLADGMKFDEANALSQKALQIQPGNPIALMLSAELASNRADFHRAQQLLQISKGALDRSPEYLRLSGFVELQLGNAEFAIVQLTRAIKARPNDLAARKFLAEAQLAVGEVDAAAKTITPISRNPYLSRDILFKLADALQKKGQFGPAATLRNYAQNGGLPAIAQKLAAADRLMANKQWGEAAKTYEDVRTSGFENDALVLNNLAWSYLHLGQARKAVQLAEVASKANPNNHAIADTLSAARAATN